MGKKLLSCAMIAVLALVAAFGCGCVRSDEGVAARYGDNVITEEEVNGYTAKFRAENGYEDDQSWASFLYEQGLSAEGWRNQAIGTIVEKQLVAQRAAELGVEADEALVDSQLEEDKAAAGIDASDDAAWEAYLQKRGTTADEYRKELEDASVQYQLLRQEVTLDKVKDSGLFDKYIQDNLVSRVVRRYKALCYGDAETAQAALDSLSPLSGDALVQAFDALLETDGTDETTSANGGDAGWDIAGSWGSMQNDLNEEMVRIGSLSRVVHESDGKYYVLLCTDRFQFEAQTTHDSLPDDELKDYVSEAATYASWSDLTDGYIAQLRDDANVQVRRMPVDVPYNVDNLIRAADEGEGADADGDGEGPSAASDTVATDGDESGSAGSSVSDKSGA